MRCNVMNYNEILFLIVMGVVMQRNCLGCYCLRWQLTFSEWGSLSGCNFPRGNYLGVHISSQLFCGAIVWVPIVQGLIIWGTISGQIFSWNNYSGCYYPEGRFSGAIIRGCKLSGGQLSGRQLSCSRFWNL